MSLFKLDQNKKYNDNRPKIGHQQHIVSPDNDSLNSTQNDNGLNIHGDSRFYDISHYFLNIGRVTSFNTVYNIGSQKFAYDINLGLFIDLNFFNNHIRSQVDSISQYYMDSIGYSGIVVSEESEEQFLESYLEYSEEELLEIDQFVIEKGWLTL